MTSRFLTVTIIITLLICKTKFPIVPVIDVDSFSVEPPKLKCESGCTLVDPGMIKKLNCFKTDDDSRSPQAKDETEVVFVADQSYYCKTNVILPDKIKFEFVKFECQFSDEKNLLMIDDSCVISYKLVTQEIDARNSLYDTLLWCLLSVILMLLLALAIQEHLKNFKNSHEEDWGIPVVEAEAVIAEREDVTNDENVDMKEKIDTKREEKIFQHNHSFLTERRRARSRSRKRI